MVPNIPDTDRRQVLVAAAIAALSPAIARSAPAENSLEAAFRAAFASTAARLAFLADTGLVIDHDVPFPLDRTAWADHLAFKASLWERSETLFHDLAVAQHGSSGIVSAYFIERGKPKNAGFRLRAGYCTAVCAMQSGTWRAIALHLAPLSAQIIDASPG